MERALALKFRHLCQYPVHDAPVQGQPEGHLEIQVVNPGKLQKPVVIFGFRRGQGYFFAAFNSFQDLCAYPLAAWKPKAADGRPLLLRNLEYVQEYPPDIQLVGVPYSFKNRAGLLPIAGTE